MGRALDVARRRPGAATATLLAAAVAVCYAPVVVGGKTLQAPLYTVSGVVPGGPWGYTGRRPANTFDIDMATPAFYEWPLDRYLGQSLRRGTLPLWNPHQGTGTPLVANYSTRVFFPFQLILNASPPALWDAFYLLRLWTAGWLTWLFLRRLGLDPTPSLVGSLGYMLSGAFVWFVNLGQYANAAMVAPLWFLAVESFVGQPGPRRAAWIALAAALNLVAGQPEISLYVFLAGTLYGAVRWLARRPAGGTGRAAAWAASGVLLGFALAAVQLAPFAAHLRHAYHLHAAGGDMGVRDPTPPALAVALFVPSFFELPTPLRDRPDNGRWDLLGGYGGLLAVFLLMAGLAGPSWGAATRWRAPLVLFAGIFGWILLKNFGAPPFDWIGRLPLLDQVWTPRWGGPTWCFALAAGSAVGLQRLMDAGSSVSRSRLLVLLLAMLAGLTVLAARGLAALGPAVTALWEFVWPGALGGWAVTAAIAGIAAIAILRPQAMPVGVVLVGLLLVERWFPIPRGHPPSLLGLRLVPAAAGLLAVVLLILARRASAGALAGLAVVGALCLDPIAPLGLPDRADPAAEPPVVRFLRARAGLGRIMGDHRVLAPNYASVFGLYDVRYVEALAVDTVQRFVEEGLETRPRRWWHALWFVGESTPLGADGALPVERDLRARLAAYSFMGVRYIVVPRGADLNTAARAQPEHFPVAYDDEVRVYENPAALPRAFVVANWETAASAAEARARALSGRIDLAARAVVEGAPPAHGGGRGRARIAEYTAHRVVVEVEAGDPALLVVTDTFYPGWRAWLNGDPATIHRVNGVVRGVFVPRGRHRVVMRFLPVSQAAGLALAAAAAVACVAMIVAGPRARADDSTEPGARRPWSRPRWLR